jgi:hypothetical protein
MPPAYDNSPIRKAVGGEGQYFPCDLRLEAGLNENERRPEENKSRLEENKSRLEENATGYSLQKLIEARG